MDYRLMAYSYGLYSHGLDSYGLNSYGQAAGGRLPSQARTSRQPVGPPRPRVGIADGGNVCRARPWPRGVVVWTACGAQHAARTVQSAVIRPGQLQHATSSTLLMLHGGMRVLQQAYCTLCAAVQAISHVRHSYSGQKLHRPQLHAESCTPHAAQCTVHGACCMLLIAYSMQRAVYRRAPYAPYTPLHAHPGLFIAHEKKMFQRLMCYDDGAPGSDTSDDESPSKRRHNRYNTVTTNHVATTSVLESSSTRAPPNGDIIVIILSQLIMLRPLVC